MKIGTHAHTQTNKIRAKMCNHLIYHILHVIVRNWFLVHFFSAWSVPSYWHISVIVRSYIKKTFVDTLKCNFRIRTTNKQFLCGTNKANTFIYIYLSMSIPRFMTGQFLYSCCATSIWTHINCATVHLYSGRLAHVAIIDVCESWGAVSIIIIYRVIEIHAATWKILMKINMLLLVI